jgi:hypothetical protein
VAGLAALLASLGVEDPAALRFMLATTAADRGVSGFDTDFGHGLADAAAAHGGVGFSQ